MILNNTHVQGLFVYNPDIEYEAGDFVVEGNSIYICSASRPTNTANNTVSGKSPKDDPENYNLYLGDKISSVREYFDFISGKSVEDKYVSNYTLSGILQRQYFGLNETGIISEGISYDLTAATVSYSLGVQDAIATISPSLPVLDRVLTSPVINNGILYISKALPEIREVILSPDVDGQVILRQHTYDNVSETRPDESNPGVSYYQRYRVQELIDPMTGGTWLRRSKGVRTDAIDDVTGERIWVYQVSSSWRSAFEVSGENYDFSERLDQIKAYYTQSLLAYKKREEQLENTFRYASVFTSVNETGSVIINYSSITPYTPERISYGISVPLYITVAVYNTQGVFTYYTTTADVYDALMSPNSNGTAIYRLSDEVSLVLMADVDKITVKVQSLAYGNNCYIKDIYYKKTY